VTAVLSLLALLSPALAASEAAAQGPLAPATPASPPWYEPYQRAVADAELENWEGAAAKIEQALKLNSKSERNVRTYGMWHASYIPYYYLGLAEYHLGKGAEALKNLQREEAAGVVQHDPIAYLKLRKISDAIQAGLKPIPAGASAAAGATASATKGGASPAGKSEALVGGLQAFFQGEYDRSISLFQEEMKRTTGDDLTLHLYLGMAYAGKASEQPGQKEIWRNLAFLEFQRVHAIDPGYTLASGIFSEEMVVLFNQAQKKK
jgi:tetratricopeptide (TPR) repeat protein